MIDFIEMLRRPELSLPATYDADDFIGMVRRRFDSFFGVFDRLDHADDNCREILNERPAIVKCSKNILQAIREYFSGSPSTAFTNIDSAIKSVRPRFDQLCIEDVKSRAFEYLYRMREAGRGNLEKQDLFHVPFEARGKVASQRYSINGLPCLYLGSSLYVCWEELGRPDVGNLQISCFEIAESERVSIVDFGIRPETMHRDLSNSRSGSTEAADNYSMFVARVVCWPLLFACSIRVRNPSDTFKPEYVVPQLLLEWITTQRGFDGVRYFSQVLPRYDMADELVLNYVFPVKNRPVKGVCKQLSRLFRMSDPVAWSVARGFAVGCWQPDTYDLDFNIVRGDQRKYIDSEFGRVQDYVDRLPKSSISTARDEVGE